MKIIFSLLIGLISSFAFASPFFLAGEDPKPANKTWHKIEKMSDEFNGNKLDSSKWQDKPRGNGWSWIGRPPALFRAENVKIKNGNMNVTVGKLPAEIVSKHTRYTHQGAIVRSHHAGQVGWYYETRMKANQTVMSSTFWLMTKGNGVKKLELDIQESVGRTSEKTKDWAKTWDQIFHSNAIHRKNSHNPEPTQIQGQYKPETKNWKRYYVYGAWWKSPKEVRFYLDGKYVYSIEPSIEFDVPAYLQMAIETYDWNPIQDDGGLVEAGNWEQRTTKYDWIRTWRLE